MCAEGKPPRRKRKRQLKKPGSAPWAKGKIGTSITPCATKGRAAPFALCVPSGKQALRRLSENAASKPAGRLQAGPERAADGHAAAVDNAQECALPRALDPGDGFGGHPPGPVDAPAKARKFAGGVFRAAQDHRCTAGAVRDEIVIGGSGHP